ncbi:hypothetical protein [Paraliomyxa miuraensis]|uniref:hypothetical protein n=1 Tax=Paraliomyxa miuraensis TaxID=376150 RepID=UPI0022559BA9|nr:hypothetical protein [Paraliomyxa miuraensis]MCX4243730.1 hypothetical protein [Paraliomyxa miuraensis]
MSPSPESSALLSRRVARALLGGVLAVALVEAIASTVVYRPALQPQDWEAAAAAVEALPPDEPVWLGTPWLGPRARLHASRLARWDAVAPADLRGAPRFHVLGLTGDRWAPTLEADREDLPPPTLVGTESLGSLELYTYELPEAGTRLGGFVEDAAELRVELAGSACRGSGRSWKCADGRVELGVVEVDHRPRRCLKLELPDGATVRLRHPGMTTGNVLRGHVGVHDFNARLRSDAPVRVRVVVDGQRVAQWLVTDSQGWWPFAVHTEPGVHDVELELSAAVRGTWQRSGYEAGQAHAPCVELRALQEAGT